MNFDLDLESGLPPWDLTVAFHGQSWPVRMPTLQQVADLIDLTGAPSSEDIFIGFKSVFSDLTGIEREAVEWIDGSIICGFIDVLGDTLRDWFNAVAVWADYRHHSLA